LKQIERKRTKIEQKGTDQTTADDQIEAGK
jgi:hypothetical protein